jgi:O-antigen/teichoic acid export membrane protein
VSVGRRIWRGTALLSIAGLLARIGTFLGNLVIIRLLGVEQVGQLGLIESWLALITMFSLFGIGVAVTRYVARYLPTDAARTGEFAGVALVLGCLLSLVVCLALYLGLDWLPASGSTARPWAILGDTKQILAEHQSVIFGLVLISTLRHIAFGIVNGLEQFQVFTFVSLAVGLLTLPCSYVLTRWHGLAGALDARLVLGALESGMLLFAASTALRRLGTRFSLRHFRSNARPLLAFGLPTFVGQLLVNPIQTLMMSFLVAQPGGVFQAGLLTVANRLVGLASFLPSAMAGTLIPVLSTEWGRDSQNRFQRSVFVALRMLWLTSLPVVLFFMAASSALLGWLYGAQYTQAWSLAFILLAVSLLAGINETGDRSLAAAGRQWLSTANNLLLSLLFLALGYRLIPHQLAFGYALAYFLAFLPYVVLQLGWLKRLFRVPLRPLLPLLAISIVSVALAWGAAQAHPSVLQIVLAAALSSIVLGIEWRTFLTQGERQALKGQWAHLTGLGADKVRDLFRSGRAGPSGN